ncbi:CDP-glucose 4,6-dehydratase [Pseudoflavonifractor sp. 524-17]|uniref:CDP-glucose 4,6-dehydratase n=1 Tax=Pseudoflavonifractor sp. 524-17 TaxID=2304577 RepID=UPI00137AB175|nr:CDP-glucose 4,6-dehydratase [Pseudoflavonifractor sp. 524-17]NCE65308.1 CDP-glucose 4,6-dehydratase [Pseudoflavonifractor sp. 524-17]
MDRQELEFYRGKRVFVTGHTGFKGSWLCRILAGAGAIVTGYSLEPPTQPNLFSLAGLEGKITSVIGDVRDRAALMAAFQAARPEIVLHLAAQPIVRDSYKAPADTYAINVMGTVNLLECVRLVPGVRSFLNVTTDKVYHNNEWVWGYREDEPLDGFDPYSNSKSCSELVTHSYQSSFFAGDGAPAISTARAGNVIGGGDFANDRILPDCVRAARAGRPLGVRNPCSTRPYQHVLEPLMAYLLIAKRQYEDKSCAGWYNVGPDEHDCVTTGQLAELFREAWGEGFAWLNQAEKDAPHEANFLKLDCSKLKAAFGWRPRWRIAQAVQKTVEWTRVWLSGGMIPAEMDREIGMYLEEGAQ